ncbi:MAG TPA: hypothetical protein VFK47_04785 [Ktedonobacteraceae bacterium]|nr:hypothetical protein [Ktedonobacteraceae bacterium]
MNKEQRCTAKRHFIAKIQEGSPWQVAAIQAGLPISQSQAYRLMKAARERGDGKYPTKWTDLACKRGTLPSILDTGTHFSRKAAPHLASFIDVL